VFARAARRGFVSLLTKDHVLSGEPSDLNEELTGSRALNAPVKQSAFGPFAPFGRTGRRAEVHLAPFFASAVLAPSFFGGQVEIVVFHLILHSE